MIAFNLRSASFINLLIEDKTSFFFGSCFVLVHNIAVIDLTTKNIQSQSELTILEVEEQQSSTRKSWVFYYTN